MPILGKAVLWLLIVDTSETRSSIAVCIKWITAGCAEENLRVTALSAAVTSFFKERRCTWWLYLRIGDNRTNVRCGNTKMKVFIMLSFLLFAKMSLKLSLKFVSLFSHLVNFIFLLLMNMQSCISYIIMAGCSVAQSCLTLCDPMDCSLPGFSVHGISQARVLKWAALSSSRGSSWPRDQTCVSCVSCTGRQILYH